MQFAYLDFLKAFHSYHLLTRHYLRRYGATGSESAYFSKIVGSGPTRGVFHVCDKRIRF